jgi:hypothetical protein
MESANVQVSVAEVQKLDFEGSMQYATQHSECTRPRLLEGSDSHFGSDFGYNNVFQVLELKSEMV